MSRAEGGCALSTAPPTSVPARIGGYRQRAISTSAAFNSAAERSLPEPSERKWATMVEARRPDVVRASLVDRACRGSCRNRRASHRRFRRVRGRRRLGLSDSDGGFPPFAAASDRASAASSCGGHPKPETQEIEALAFRREAATLGIQLQAAIHEEKCLAAFERCPHLGRGQSPSGQNYQRSEPIPHHFVQESVGTGRARARLDKTGESGLPWATSCDLNRPIRNPVRRPYVDTSRANPEWAVHRWFDGDHAGGAPDQCWKRSHRCLPRQHEPVPGAGTW